MRRYVCALLYGLVDAVTGGRPPLSPLEVGAFVTFLRSRGVALCEWNTKDLEWMPMLPTRLADLEREFTEVVRR